MTLSVDYSVFRDLKTNLSRLSYDLRRKGDLALRRCAEDLLEKAIDLAPKDTGALRESGKVEKLGDADYRVLFDVTVRDRIKKQGRSLKGISNPDFHYSGIQHDNLYYHHDIGQALFLEEPYESNKDDYIGSVARALQETTRRTKWARRGGGWSRRGRR